MNTPFMSPRFGLVSVSVLSIAGANADLDFNRDVRPILSANCFSCHGPDQEARAPYYISYLL